MIQKGTICALLEAGRKVTVKPYSGEVVTVPLVVPFFLLGSLEIDMAVVYAAFEDNTGVVIARMDGEWSHELEGDVFIEGDLMTGEVSSYNAHTHSTPDGQSGTPQ